MATAEHFVNHALPIIVGVIAAVVISWLVWKYSTSRE